MKSAQQNKEEIVFLQPGQIHYGGGSYKVCTVLGSCISVCLWDKIMKHGSINHYIFPSIPVDGGERGRYGDSSIKDMVSKLNKMGSPNSQIVAKIFGGAKMVENNKSEIFSTGKNNIMMALKITRELGIRIVTQDIGGNKGRRICFNMSSGVVETVYINKPNRDE